MAQEPELDTPPERALQTSFTQRDHTALLVLIGIAGLVSALSESVTDAIAYSSFAA